VTATANRQRQASFRSHGDGSTDIVCTDGADDGSWPTIDEPIPYTSPQVVVGVTWTDDLSGYTRSHKPICVLLVAHPVDPFRKNRSRRGHDGTNTPANAPVTEPPTSDARR
jgi:hypothetical protein